MSRQIKLPLLLVGLALLALTTYVFWPRSPASPEQALDAPAFESLVPPPLFQSEPNVVFKWQDSSGAWHYGDTPPAEGIPRAINLSPPAPQLAPDARPSDSPQAGTQPGS